MGFKYAIRDDTAYFLTHTVVGWIDVFTRMELCEVITSSLNFCSRQKGLEIYGWCLMPSHLHMIANSKQGNPDNLSDIMRDFKKFTSNQVIKSINEIGESRREWLLPLLQTDRNSWQLWKEGMHPVGLYKRKFTRQKLDYIHSNPVVAGIVEEPQHYLLSSARDYYCNRKGPVDLCCIG